jgi:hypothetical protein
MINNKIKTVTARHFVIAFAITVFYYHVESPKTYQKVNYNHYNSL